MDHITALPIRAGRPTREQAVLRRAQLLDVALDHFLEKGFENSTIESIANAVNMTKRTVYALYDDKVALFRAAVLRAIENLAVTEKEMQSTLCDTMQETLVKIAHLRVDRVMTPMGLKLQRIINTESYRFPDIFIQSYQLGALPVIKFLSKYLKNNVKKENLALPDPSLAANVFISMVVSGPVRIIVSGNYLDSQEMERRIAFSVNLFLNGIKNR
ncbi:MAG: hypothetical protein RLY97_2038 [Pseudomonadota bacterium]